MLSTDTATHATCTGGCGTVWPSLYSVGKPRAGTGITASLIKTFVRSNGQRQVTYNGHPLYYYAGDSAAGEDNGECLPQNPGTWYILNSAGKRISGPCGATPTPSTSTSAPPPAPCDTAPPADATIEVSAADKFHGATDLGKVLEDGRGCTVYMYIHDTDGGTPWNDAAPWPPVTTGSLPSLSTGLNCTLALKPTVADSSKQQVTCNGHPLYFYDPDSLTSDAQGQGSGGVWFVLDASGNQVGP